MDSRKEYPFCLTCRIKCARSGFRADGCQDLQFVNHRAEGIMELCGPQVGRLCLRVYLSS